MRIAVIQHRLRGDAAEDAAALVAGARRAEEAGAGLVLLPEVLSLSGHPSLDGVFQALASGPPHVLPDVGPDTRGVWVPPAVLPGLERLGRVAMPVGDPAIDPDAVARYREDPPDVLLMSPRSESDLQAEAVLEYAVGLSGSLCGLVVITEPVGAPLGAPGHGGSAIVRLGEVLAEAGEGDDVLLADIDLPVPRPERTQSFPGLPTILEQRLAVHRGVRHEPGYPAELT